MAAAVVAVGLLGVLGVVSWVRSPSRAEVPNSTQVASAAPQTEIDPQLGIRSKGDSAAPITIFELSDFQCPWCRKFTVETLPLIQQEYIDQGKVRLVFINLPIPSLHPNAPAAHEFAMCAADQDKFWPMHDLLFEHQEAWQDLEEPTDFFGDLADSISLSGDSLSSCLEAGAMRRLVMADVNSARQAQLQKTPIFIVEGGVLEGAAEIGDWRSILDSIYTAKTAAN